MKNVKKFMLIACALMLSFTAVSAANYTAIPGTKTKLDKYLVVEADAEIPEAEFTFTMGAGNAVEATADTVKTWAGLNPELVKVNGTAGSGKVNFVAGEAATAGPLDGVATAEQKYAVKDINLDFSAVNYAEPGVYRYTITEAAPLNGSPIKHDEEPVRTIDVYVEDVNGVLKVKGYVVYEGTITDAAKTLPSPIALPDLTEWDAQNPAPTVVANPGERPVPVDPENPTPEEEAAETEWNTASGAYNQYLADKADYDANRAAEIARQEAANLAAAAAEVPNGAEAGTPKNNKYVNAMDSADLKVKKTVSGNQASHDEYFEFTITVNNAGAGTVMTLDMTGAETSTHENTATSFTKAAMDAANQKDDDNEPVDKFFAVIPDVVYDALSPQDKAAFLSVEEIEVPIPQQEGDPVIRKAYKVEFADTDARSAFNQAHSFDPTGMPEAYVLTLIAEDDEEVAPKAGQQVIADENGTATFKVYLHHGQEAVLKGLPVGATYTVAETPAAGYQTRYNVKVGSADAVEKQAVADERIGADDVEVDTINHRNGVIPTGLFLAVGTPLAVGAVAAGLFIARRNKEDEE